MCVCSGLSGCSRPSWSLCSDSSISHPRTPSPSTAVQRFALWGWGSPLPTNVSLNQGFVVLKMTLLVTLFALRAFTFPCCLWPRIADFSPSGSRGHGKALQILHPHYALCVCVCVNILPECKQGVGLLPCSLLCFQCLHRAWHVVGTQ